MNYIDKHVQIFKGYARQALDEQVRQLVAYEQSHLLSGKLDRIRLFNAHQESLKQILSDKIGVMIKAAVEDAPGTADELKAHLHIAESDSVNEFLCMTFIKA